MKLSEFENLTSSQLEKLDIQQLKKIASEQGQKLNKRLDRINSSRATNKSAVRSVKKSGGRFGVGGLTVKNRKGEVNISATKQNLISEIKREQKFQKAKTGTVKGAKEVKEESEKKVTGTTSKEYSKKKASEYRKKEKERKEKEQGHKLTKTQKKRIEKEAKRKEKEAKKEFDKRTSEAWEQFHKWKETHPATAQSYSKDRVKQIVNEYNVSALKSGDWSKFDDGKVFERAVNQAKRESEQQPDVWSTVDKDNPFDVQETPEQFTLRNGRIV